jgi:hypothetical protein
VARLTSSHLRPQGTCRGKLDLVAGAASHRHRCSLFVAVRNSLGWHHRSAGTWEEPVDHSIRPDSGCSMVAAVAVGRIVDCTRFNVSNSSVLSADEGESTNLSLAVAKGCSPDPSSAVVWLHASSTTTARGDATEQEEEEYEAQDDNR